MEIIKGIDIVDLGLWIRKHKALVFADFHIGYEEHLAKKGVLIPKFQFKDLVLRLEKILKKIKPKTIIINGDIKHEFGTISEQEWRETLKIIDFLASKCERLVLTKGNHDTILGPIARKRNIELVDKVVLGDVAVFHGDKIKETDAKVIIMGHEHPAVSLKEEARVEKFKCFLKGKYQGKTLIVMPSFNLVTTGTDVISEKMLSPYLQQDLRNFECWIVEDKVYYFGRVRNLENS